MVRGDSSPESMESEHSGYMEEKTHDSMTAVFCRAAVDGWVTFMDMWYVI